MSAALPDDLDATAGSWCGCHTVCSCPADIGEGVRDGQMQTMWHGENCGPPSCDPHILSVYQFTDCTSCLWYLTFIFSSIVSMSTRFFNTHSEAAIIKSDWVAA